VTPAPQRFSVLALLYLVTNARIGSGDKRRRVQRVMTRAERAAVTEVLERLPSTIASWSDGLAVWEPMHLVEVRRQLNSLSSSGEGRWWAGPRDCREELAELAAETRYDCVFVLWPSAPDVPLCGWGCTVEPSEATFGAGFTSIASDHWETLLTDPDPEQGYVHEWLHQVEATYRGLGLGDDELPTLHDAAAFTSTRPATEQPFGRSYAEYHDGSSGVEGARTWAPWYRDWMTGRLRRLEAAESAASAGTSDGGSDAASEAAGLGAAADAADLEAAPLGMTPERWALRAR